MESNLIKEQKETEKAKVGKMNYKLVEHFIDCQ